MASSSSIIKRKQRGIREEKGEGLEGEGLEGEGVAEGKRKEEERVKYQGIYLPPSIHG